MTSEQRDEKQKRIMALLAKLGVRRQAKLDTPDYLVLAEELVKFDERDIAAGLDDVAKYPRREGETAFPELPRLKQAIIERKLTREAEEQREQEREQARYREEHPEEFCTMGDVFREWEANRKPSQRDIERDEESERKRAIADKAKSMLSTEERARVEAYRALNTIPEGDAA